MRARPICVIIALATAIALPATTAKGAPGVYAHDIFALAPLGNVRFIDHGLAVQPPKKKPQKGRLKMSLFANYGLHTAASQRASVAFRDGSLLHMNQRTDAVLRSPSLTYVAQGEVDQVVIPGTKHRVKTNAAIASAIGTIFDVKISAGVTIITVVQGVVRVKTAQGTVQVSTNQQTSVTPGQAPTPPVIVNAQSVTGWTQGIPAPTPNLVLNGDAEQAAGAIDSSTRVAAPHWAGTGTFTTVKYGTSGFPSLTDFGPPDRGKNFFAGGPNAAVSTGSQTVDVSRFASAIDGGGMVMYASAWLGGFSTQNDSATVSFTSQNAGHQALDHQLILGPATEAQRGGQTGLIEWHGLVHVPAHTRFILVVMHMTRTDGIYNDGYVDNVTLQLDSA
jgi:FecR protein